MIEKKLDSRPDFNEILDWLLYKKHFQVSTKL